MLTHFTQRNRPEEVMRIHKNSIALTEYTKYYCQMQKLETAQVLQKQCKNRTKELGRTQVKLVYNTTIVLFTLSLYFDLDIQVRQGIGQIMQSLKQTTKTFTIHAFICMKESNRTIHGNDKIFTGWSIPNTFLHTFTLKNKHVQLQS